MLVQSLAQCLVPPQNDAKIMPRPRQDLTSAMGTFAENPYARAWVPCHVLIEQIDVSSKLFVFLSKNVGLERTQRQDHAKT